MIQLMRYQYDLETIGSKRLKLSNAQECHLLPLVRQMHEFVQFLWLSLQLIRNVYSIEERARKF